MNHLSSHKPSFALSRRSFLAIFRHDTRRHCRAGLCTPGNPRQNQPRRKPREPSGVPIGLELYSVRGELARDLPNTLKSVAKMGYEVVEFYAPYFKWTPPYAKEVRAQMDDLGIRCYSTHNGFESFTPGDNFAHAIELNQILGAALYRPRQRSRTQRGRWLENLGEKLTSASDQLKPHGLSAGIPQIIRRNGPNWKNGQRIIEVIARQHSLKNLRCSWIVGTCEEAGADPDGPGLKPIPDASKACISKIGRKKRVITSSSPRA